MFSLVIIMGWSLGESTIFAISKKVSCKTKEKFIARTSQKLPSLPNSIKYFLKIVANYLTKICICGIV